MHEAVLEYILGNDDRPLRCLKARVLHMRAIVVSVICLCISGCMSPHGNEAATLLADIAAVDGPSRLNAITPEPVRLLIAFVGPPLATQSRISMNQPNSRGAQLSLFQG
jgi:hypothetical protein